MELKLLYINLICLGENEVKNKNNSAKALLIVLLLGIITATII